MKGASFSADGDSDQGDAGVAMRRPTASRASTRSAKAAAEASRQACGKTRVPDSTATVTEVVNDSTSITTRHATADESRSAPVGPQSNRAPLPACRYQSSSMAMTMAGTQLPPATGASVY